MTATATRAAPSYRRSLLLVTGSGALVPLAGLATAPLLTQHLGVAGRGELGAALAPNTLIAGAATLGLPDAVAYVVARRPELGRAVIGRGLAFTAAAGGLAALVTVLAGPMLAAGDAGLSSLIALGRDGRPGPGGGGAPRARPAGGSAGTSSRGSAGSARCCGCWRSCCSPSPVT